ncbi:MAG: 16S rRNA (adenine(1518)-N(6)/adenine(1519)-N(6))-dimethyltransferase RsmA [Bacteroidales bacterium]|nr:16S rRNA (adenine(1518)-N(6)/adenine(1519)-N(6))-dimethyltransferase RsmA [Bacteroidales bacterium]
MERDEKFVRAKKHLGQHFLKDKNIAQKIAETVSQWQGNLIEIGPGTGVLTQFLVNRTGSFMAIDLDRESIDYLKNNQILTDNQLLFGDFLKLDLMAIFQKQEFAIIGNFPYNISSQIVFKALEYREFVPVFAGMFQKEVAERIAMKPGSKTYGILSVLCQAFFHVEYLFSVPPTVFSPPPKVNSAVIRMTRKENFALSCNEQLFFRIVKESFNTRRKMLRTSLKSYLNDRISSNPIFEKRPEQLGYEAFVEIVNLIESNEIQKL